MSTLLTEKEVSNLLDSCIKAKENSYSPYSKFRVGAALYTTCGKTFTGCNVENVSYGLAICAERTAYVKAVSEGYTSFKACAVSTDVKDSFTYPCGACRQFMSEFGDVEVFLTNDDKNHTITTLKKLLPFQFSAEELKNGSSM
ncbi:probable cytidine deaminase [Hydra vulgaris]|uniref:Cytidine deaminase n=1 Tax=Hydra vulgaris TaxID=6087 RepID=T2MG67_HYDVU|nr:probable cytidine deaminase [Hydra vulgaris]